MTLSDLLDHWTGEAWAEHARGNLVAAHTYWRCREELARALTEGPIMGGDAGRIVKLDQKEANSGTWAKACIHVAALWPLLREYSVRKGIIKECYDLYQAQGDFGLSGGTHRQGTAVDIRQYALPIPLVFRLAGFPGTWRRGPVVGQKKFGNHIHAATDCPCWSGADYQINEVEKLRQDGMVGTGKDYEAVPDVWRDWAAGKRWLERELKHLRAPIQKITVDGKLGPQTYRRLQQWMGANVVDGVFGQQSKRLLQGWLNVPQDGVFGPTSTKALQKLVGAMQDGQWGPQTTKALQTYLNTHR